jgi:lysophospholipase L1-like esterase
VRAIAFRTSWSWRRGGNAGPLELVANLGVNGYTSADLIREELPDLDRLRPRFATLLIGVNDVVQGVPGATYDANVITILEALRARRAAGRVVPVAIPDYTVTPAGADYGDPRRQHDAIVAANATMARLAGDRGMAFADIFDLSRRAADDRSLVAADGLHPSSAQYPSWPNGSRRSFAGCSSPERRRRISAARGALVLELVEPRV